MPSWATSTLGSMTFVKQSILQQEEEVGVVAHFTGGRRRRKKDYCNARRQRPKSTRTTLKRGRMNGHIGATTYIHTRQWLFVQRDIIPHLPARHKTNKKNKMQHTVHACMHMQQPGE